MMRLTFAAILLVAGTAVGQAQEAEGPYMGFSIGSLDYEESDDELGLSISDSTEAYRIFGGYQFTENFGFEAGWGATGDIEENFSVFDPFLGDVSLNVKGDYQLITLRALGALPVGRARLFGGVGYYDAKLDLSVRYEDDFGVLTASGDDSDSGATVIAGVAFPIGRASIRAEYEWFDTDSSVEASVFSLGLSFGL